MLGKKTPLYQAHADAGGRMTEFGGWLMPVRYSGIIAEHHAVRNAAGLFDASHMGEFIVTGPGAQDFIQQLVTNDISVMRAGRVQYSPMCYENGGTADDLLIYKFADDRYMLVVNAGNTDSDWQWLSDHKAGFDVTLNDVSADNALLALQGPRAQDILTMLASADPGALAYYYFLPEITVAGCPVLLSRTGYTGEDGFELYCRARDAETIWRQLLSAGRSRGLLPAGLGARDTLRFEACLPLYGHELSANITPVEAGLGMFVKEDKDGFNGQAVLAAQKKQGPSRKLAGLEMIGRGIPRAGYPVWANGREIGHITTGSVSPTLNKNLGLALVERQYAAPGQKVSVDIRGKHIEAMVIARPFYKRG